MLASPNNKSLLMSLAKVVLLIGAINWGVTAYRMHDDVVPDLIALIVAETNAETMMPIKLVNLQKIVYGTVLASGLLVTFLK